jgi:hypothetical protein
VVFTSLAIGSATATTAIAPNTSSVLGFHVSAIRTAAITSIHPSGGTRNQARSAKTAMPASDPMMSKRYASSAGNFWKRCATPCAIIVMIAATAMKTAGSISQVGRPCVSSDPKYRRLPPVRSIVTGNALTSPRNTASETGANTKRSGFLCPRRNPRPMPRKLPSSTKFEKYDR